MSQKTSQKSNALPTPNDPYIGERARSDRSPNRLLNAVASASSTASLSPRAVQVVVSQSHAESPRAPRVQLPWSSGKPGVLSESLHINEIPHVWGSRLAPELSTPLSFAGLQKLSLAGLCFVPQLYARPLARATGRSAGLMGTVSFYASVLASAYVTTFFLFGAVLILCG